MNFGPLNKGGGERRLNVAITRARYRVKLIGSIYPTDIDLTRSQSEGIKRLRNYMKFAINGPDAIDAEVLITPNAECESPFEESVYEALVKKGLTVTKQVGCAGYRVDLGVVDPNCHGRYILGIECDGATYHSSKTARDRDRLRQMVLEDLGWHIHRIWSTAWIKNKNNEIERITEAIKKIT